MELSTLPRRTDCSCNASEGGAPLEVECERGGRAAQAEVLQQVGVLLLVVDVAINDADVAPVERVVHSGQRLPRQLRGSGADIRVIRQGPATPHFCAAPTAHRAV